MVINTQLLVCVFRGASITDFFLLKAVWRHFDQLSPYFQKLVLCCL